MLRVTAPGRGRWYDAPDRWHQALANVGDPIWPRPADIALPRLLDGEPISLRGYPMEMVLAEKIVTALQRGQASTPMTRLRRHLSVDRHLQFRGDRSTLGHRGRCPAPHRRRHRPRYGTGWIRRHRTAALEHMVEKFQIDRDLPSDFAEILAALQDFADPVLTGTLGADASWDHASRRWNQWGRLQTPAPASSTSLRWPSRRREAVAWAIDHRATKIFTYEASVVTLHPASAELIMILGQLTPRCAVSMRDHQSTPRETPARQNKHAPRRT